MKTAWTIEAQEARKEAEKREHVATQNSGPVRGRVENLKPWPKGVSGNPKVDLAAEIARLIFEQDGPAIFAAFQKMLRKGSPYAFQVLADRAYGKLKERVEIDRGAYADLSEEQLQTRMRELESQLGIPHAEPEEKAPPISDGSKRSRMLRRQICPDWLMDSSQS